MQELIFSDVENVSGGYLSEFSVILGYDPYGNPIYRDPYAPSPQPEMEP